MNKNQTIELLEKQLPGFYSVDQVIKIIQDIEGGEGNSFINIDQLVELIQAHIRDQISNMESDNACDFSSAEFILSGNEIQLDCVDLEARNIASEAVCGLEDAIEGFLETART